MSYSISNIAQIINGKAQLPFSDFRIKHLSIDSRRIIDTEATLFLLSRGHETMAIIILLN